MHADTLAHCAVVHYIVIIIIIIIIIILIISERRTAITRIYIIKFSVAIRKKILEYEKRQFQ